MVSIRDNDFNLGRSVPIMRGMQPNTVTRMTTTKHPIQTHIHFLRLLTGTSSVAAFIALFASVKGFGSSDGGFGTSHEAADIGLPKPPLRQEKEAFGLCISTIAMHTKGMMIHFQFKIWSRKWVLCLLVWDLKCQPISVVEPAAKLCFKELLFIGPKML